MTQAASDAEGEAVRRAVEAGEACGMHYLGRGVTGRRGDRVGAIVSFAVGEGAWAEGVLSPAEKARTAEVRRLEAAARTTVEELRAAAAEGSVGMLGRRRGQR